MVNSKINKKINYLETNFVNINDIDHEAYIYIGNLYNKNIKFTVGLPIYEFIDNNIIYFNIYLVKNSIVVAKIGLYEVTKNAFDSLLNIDGDIDFKQLEPIIFSFVKQYINQYYDEEVVFDDKEEKNDSDDSDDSDDSHDSNDSDDFDDSDDSDKNTKIEDKKEKTIKKIATTNDYIVTLKEQSKEESDLEISNYKQNTSSKWINDYLQNNKYDIIDNEGGGDCFFAVLRDSLKSSNVEKYKNITVKNIREKLSNEADDSLFNIYKELSEFYIGGYKKSILDKSNKLKKFSLQKKQLAGTNDTSEKNEILEYAKQNIEDINEESEKNKEFKILQEEFEFMKDLKSLAELKEVIKTNKYWADAWAISTLERIYNVKFIIFSKEHYDGNENENVIQCLDLDNKILEKGVFQPIFYILSHYEQDTHYKLISYDKNYNKSIFTFSELPYRIKELFIDKCLEKTNCKSNYLIIPEIKEFSKCDQDNINELNINNEFEEFIQTSKSLDIDNNVIIQIYNKSMDKKVGEGSGEKIEKEYKILPNILKLNKIKSWRKKLDNDWHVDNLLIDGYQFTSVQHYLYAIRFSNIKEIFSKFLKESQHKAGSDIQEAKDLFNKILKDKTIYNEKFITDSEYNKNLSKNLEKALYSKFTQNDELKEILELTKNYKIQIYKHKQPISIAKELMNIRKLIFK
tara:strand:+ start:3497 stop:5554 length:2058 start_codon:yes stop_codon:yes gene_type:complete